MGLIITRTMMKVLLLGYHAYIKPQLFSDPSCFLRDLRLFTKYLVPPPKGLDDANLFELINRKKCAYLLVTCLLNTSINTWLGAPA